MIWSDTHRFLSNEHLGQVADTGLTEADYHRLWLTFPREFITIEGHKITVLDGGISSGNAGPDFLNAIILTKNDVLQGSVEIHINEAGWWRHGHHTDERYQDVLLHAVVEASRKTQPQPDGFAPQHTITLPTWPDRENMTPSVSPCEPAPIFPDDERLLVRLGWERVEKKAVKFAELLSSHSLNSLWYQKTLRSLGYGSNHDSMEKISDELPLSLARELAIHLTAEQLFDFVLGFLGYGPFYGIETPVWQQMETELDISGYHYSEWKPLHSRPMNHPLLRLYLFFRHCDSWFQRYQAGRSGFSTGEYIRSMQVVEPLPAGYRQLFRINTLSIGSSQVVELLVNAYIPLWLHKADEAEHQSLFTWADDLPAIPVYGRLKKYLRGLSPGTLRPLLMQGLLAVDKEYNEYGHSSGSFSSPTL